MASRLTYRIAAIKPLGENHAARHVKKNIANKQRGAQTGLFRRYRFFFPAAAVGAAPILP